MSRRTGRRHNLTPLELRAKSGRKRRAQENRRKRLALGFVNRHEDRANEPIHRKEVLATKRADLKAAAKEAR